MKQIIFLILALTVAYETNAGSTICSLNEKTSWDKMKEGDFTKVKVQEKLKDLEKVFNGELEVAEEFIWQANTVIEGAFLLQEVHRSRPDAEHFKYAKKAFCQFMSERAYLAH